MKKSASLLVLAAGMGSRYGGLKQLDPVGPSGEIILDYSIYDALRAGFDRIVFVIRRDIEKEFRAKVGGKWENKTDVRYVFQELDMLPDGASVPEGRVKPWGTGHAVLCAKKELDTPFGVINADDFYGRDAFAKLHAALTDEKRTSDRHCMVGFILRNTLSENGSVSRGVCMLTLDGQLKEINERTGLISDGAYGAVYAGDNGILYHLSGNETVSMNMWGFMPGFAGELDSMFGTFIARQGGELKSEFYLPSAVFELVKAGKASVDVLRSDSSWFGVTYREDKPLVQKAILGLIEAGEYPASLG